MATESLPEVSLSLTYYWVRHGETEANRAGILQGQSDFPLTESGKEGAIKTGVYLSKVAFDHLYVSDLERATRTAIMILDENQVYLARLQQSNGDDDSSVQLKKVSLVREKYYGVKENMPRDCSWEEAAEQAAKQRGITIEEALQDNEEPLELLLRRTQEFLELCKDDVMKCIGESQDIITGSRIERNILCVSHSGFISNFLRSLSHFGNQNREMSYEGKLHNCSCHCVRLEYVTPSQKPAIFIDNSLVNLHEHLTHTEQDRQLWPVLDPDIVQNSLSTVVEK